MNSLKLIAGGLQGQVAAHERAATPATVAEQSQAS